MARHPQSGVTLIEMLVVLSIIGISAGVLTLRFSDLARDDPKTEAGHLAEVLTDAAEAALYSGNPAALIWSQAGYHVETFNPGMGWQMAAGAGQRDLATGINLRRNDGHDGPLIIAPGGIALPARFLMAAGSEAWRVDFNGLVAEVKAPDDVGPAQQ